MLSRSQREENSLLRSHRCEDLDGAKFALSEYRGKVVLLDFWGDW